jgi:hypothetical protein
MANAIALIRSHILSEVRCNVILTNGEIHFDKTVCVHEEISTGGGVERTECLIDM